MSRQAVNSHPLTKALSIGGQGGSPSRHGVDQCRCHVTDARARDQPGSDSAARCGGGRRGILRPWCHRRRPRDHPRHHRVRRSARSARRAWADPHRDRARSNVGGFHAANPATPTTFATCCSTLPTCCHQRSSRSVRRTGRPPTIRWRSSIHSATWPMRPTSTGRGWPSSHALLRHRHRSHGCRDRQRGRTSLRPAW